MTRTRQGRVSSAATKRLLGSARTKLLAVSLGASAALGCAADDSSDAPKDEPKVAVTQQALEQRAYIVSRESDELTVLDLKSMDIIAQVPTGGVENHMAELSADFSKVYISSSGADEILVVDARTLQVNKHIPVGKHSTHLSVSHDGKLLAVMDEDEGSGAVSFIDTAKDEEIKRLPGFYTPHFMRFSADGRYGYVANLNAHHITRVDLETLEIESQIALDGFSDKEVTPAPDEGGFADAQIGADGMLYAAHAATGRVLVYDTEKHVKMPELKVGKQPWIVYAEHPFPEITSHVVPNFGDESISLIAGKTPAVKGIVKAADRESFGVNYSPMVPDRAFVMNRYRQEVAVVDTKQMKAMDVIDVGGTTETAATTADGLYVVASVSGSNRIVVIDAIKAEVFKAFDDIGLYPWSVTIPHGQNYCH